MPETPYATDADRRMTPDQLHACLVEPLTRTWLSERLGVNRVTLQRWLAGHDPIPWRVPGEVSRALASLASELAAVAAKAGGEYAPMDFSATVCGVRYTSTPDATASGIAARVQCGTAADGCFETVDVAGMVRLGIVSHFPGGMMLASSRQGARLYTPWRDEALRFLFADAWTLRSGPADVYETTLRAFVAVGLATAEPA